MKVARSRDIIDAWYDLPDLEELSCVDISLILDGLPSMTVHPESESTVVILPLKNELLDADAFNATSSRR